MGAGVLNILSELQIILEIIFGLCRIEDIPTEQYPTPAQRPLNSRLDCSSFTGEFGIKRPDWREGLDAILADLVAKT